MKRYLFSLTLTFSFLFGYSQFSTFDFKDLKTNSLVSGSNSYDYVTSPHTSLTHTFEIKNKSTVTQSFYFKKTEPLINKVAPGDSAYAYFCTGNTCEVSTTMASTVTLNPSEVMIIRFDFEEASAIGKSIVNYTVASVASGTESLSLNFKYNGSLSLKKNTPTLSDNISVYPNPVSGNRLGFVALSEEPMNIEIQDVNGSLISSEYINVKTGINEVYLDRTAGPGIYFVTFSGTNSRIVKKIILTD